MPICFAECDPKHVFGGFCYVYSNEKKESDLNVALQHCQSISPPGQISDMRNIEDPIQIFYQTLKNSGEFLLLHL